MAKKFLAEKGVKYQEADVSIDRQAASEMVSISGQMGVPVVVIDGEAIIGFNRTRIEELIGSTHASGKISLGLSIADADKILRIPGTESQNGIYIGSVKPQSLGEKAGLRAGDVITHINEVPVSTVAEIPKILASFTGNASITFRYLRDGDNLISTIFT